MPPYSIKCTIGPAGNCRAEAEVQLFETYGIGISTWVHGPEVPGSTVQHACMNAKKAVIDELRRIANILEAAP